MVIDLGLVADLLEVFAKLDDRVEGVGRLDRVGVVGDEERLCGLVGDDALLALSCVSLPSFVFSFINCVAPSLPSASRRSPRWSCTFRR
jgi:hypothetical protein